MTHRSFRTALSINEAVRLIGKREFRREARVAGVTMAQTVLAEEAEKLRIELARVCLPFVERWGVLPPPDVQLVSKRARSVLAAYGGRWGIIAIYPWTRQGEVLSSFRQIGANLRRSGTPGEHRDAEGKRRAYLARYLRLNGFSNAEIAEAVWDRHDHLRLPRWADITADDESETQEEKLMTQYRAEGMPRSTAARRVRRRMRGGSEARARAQVRMTISRLLKTEGWWVTRAMKMHQGDTAGHRLTEFIRAALAREDSETIRQRAIHLLTALSRRPR